MDELTNLDLDELLRRVAARAPTPGGGSVAAAACALACALGRMVAAYSTGSTTDSEASKPIDASAANLQRLEQIAAALVTQDAHAYEAMTAAAKRRRESPDAERAHHRAVLAAVAVPMEIAAVASRALAALDDMKAAANRNLVSDLAISAVLADAAAESARYLVHLNAGSITDPDRRSAVLAEIDQTVQHGHEHRRAIERMMSAELEIGPVPGR